MTWKVTVYRSKTHRFGWAYRLMTPGAKTPWTMARRGRGFDSQAQAAYAAGRATDAEVQAQHLLTWPSILTDFGPQSLSLSPANRVEPKNNDSK